MKKEIADSRGRQETKQAQIIQSTQMNLHYAQSTNNPGETKNPNII